MGERIAELVDQAQLQQQENEARALSKVRAALGPETHPDFDGKHCLDCGDTIPQKRRMMDKIRCVNCQDALERGSKLRRK